MAAAAAVMRVTVYGLGHQGAVTAACLAAAGHRVVGLDDDAARLQELARARPREVEPGLPERLHDGVRRGNLRFTTDPSHALGDTEVLWIAFDTPLHDDDAPDVAWLWDRIDRLSPYLRTGTLVVLSSPAPAGFLRALEARWRERGVGLAAAPENLRVGDAVRSFEQAERVVVGVRSAADRARLEALFAPFARSIEWMSPESAEMTKHALNAWLATSVAFVNELARLCEAAGADVAEVERGLKSDPRVGQRPYFSPGAPFSGGTLARDLRALSSLAAEQGLEAPLALAVLASNAEHQRWVLRAVRGALRGVSQPAAAVLGLAYKPGTDELRRSAAVDLALALQGDGVAVRAHDPALRALPAVLAGRVELCADPRTALRDTDVAVIATACPEYALLTAEDVVAGMRRPWVVDVAGVLRAALADDARLRYVSPGRARRAGP
jgi:UDPglucose 6-dehydrogenase